MSELLMERDLTSVDLRAQSVGEFHPVSVEEVFLAENRIFNSDRETVLASNLRNAGSVCIVVRHPNGERELVYEYVDTIIRNGQADILTVETGDTIWIAEWEDIHRPILTPGDRDYVIAQDREEAERQRPRRDRIDLSVIAATLLTTIGLFAAGVVGLIGLLGSPSLNGLGHLFVSALLIYLTYLIPKRVPRLFATPHEQTLSALVTSPDDIDEDALGQESVRGIGDRLESITRNLSTWDTATIEDVSVRDGEIEIIHPAVEESLVAEFDSPRKWDADQYDIVALSEEMNVGSAEHLIGETVEVTMDTRDATEGYPDADGWIRLRVP